MPEDDITIIPCSNETELFHHYPSQTVRQDCFIEVRLREHRLLADYDPEIEGGLPPAVVHGFVRRYFVPVLTGTAANRIMDEIAPLAERMCADWEESWNERNFIAELGEDGQAAEDEIRAQLEALDDDSPEDDQDLVAIYGIEAATTGDEVAEYSITAATTDERLDEIEAAITAELAETSASGVAVCPGLAEFLHERREELRNDTEVIWSVMSGPSPQARAVEPGPIAVDVPDEVLAWAEDHGLSPDAPDIYLLVTPEDEAGRVDNEIDWMKADLPATEVAKIRARLDAPRD